MLWHSSYRTDPRARELADRHYNRQKIGSPNFVPPGRCCVLFTQTPTGRAFWVTSAPYAQYVRHRWAGAWVCTAFRNEGAGVASELILQAISASIYRLGPPPTLGMITFIDRSKVRPTKVHGRAVWGWTYRKAGFVEVGETVVEKHLALQLLPHQMPPPIKPLPELWP